MNVNFYSPVDSFLNHCIGMMLEAFPFLMLGIALSSAIQVLVPSNWFQNHFPKKTLPGIFYALIAGFFLPVCDCASVPVFRGLIKKKVPLPAALTFMLASPVVNPVVVLSTLAAFPTSRHMLYARLGLGVCIAVMAGLIMQLWLKMAKGSSKESDAEFVLNHFMHQGLSESTCACGCCHAHAHEHEHLDHHHHHEHHYDKQHDHYHGHKHTEHTHVHEDHEQEHQAKSPLKQILIHYLSHVKTEFFEVAHYLLIGILISALFQTIYKIYGNQLGQFSWFWGTLFMIFLAYVLSLCSSSDAIVARSFIAQVGPAAVLGFLVVGPMIDIKNTLMLYRSFKIGFIAKLLMLILLLSLVALTLFHYLVPTTYLSFV